MRHLYPYTRTWAVPASTPPIFKMHLVDFTRGLATGSKIDLWARVVYRLATDTAEIYFCKTLAAAEAITTLLADSAARTAAGVVAWDTILESRTPNQGNTATNQAGVDPDMTNLKYAYESSTFVADWDAVWGYDAAPEVVINEEILYLLEQRMGSGQALADFTAAKLKRGPDGYKIQAGSPNAVASLTQMVAEDTSALDYARQINFVVAAGTLGKDGGGDDAYDAASRYAGNITSILGDEHRTLTGLVDEVKIVQTTSPEQTEGEEEPYMAARVEGFARIFRMFADV